MRQLMSNKSLFTRDPKLNKIKTKMVFGRPHIVEIQGGEKEEKEFSKDISNTYTIQIFKRHVITLNVSINLVRLKISHVLFALFVV